jgi:hypothetical protein
VEPLHARPTGTETCWGDSADGFGGAYARIGYGTQWNLRGNAYRFTWRGYHGSAGQGQNIHDNAAAHHWVYGPCGHYNDNF